MTLFSESCSFYFSFSGTYVGVGMISPYLINASMLVGAIVSWGFLWPFIESKKGSWYDADLQDTSLKGLNGYKVTVARLLCDEMASHWIHSVSLIILTTDRCSAP
jgi:uncharacterized oligopeptide transporter (OPT) family protein